MRGASDVIGSDWETRLMARRESIRVAQRKSCCAKAVPGSRKKLPVGLSFPSRKAGPAKRECQWHSGRGGPVPRAGPTGGTGESGESGETGETGETGEALRDADWCQRFHGPKIAEALERGSAVASSRPRIPSRGSSKAEALCSELSERGSGDTEQAAVQIAGASLTLWPSGSFEIPSPGCRTKRIPRGNPGTEAGPVSTR